MTTTDARDWRNDGVRVIPGTALDANTAQTPGMSRAAAITHARVGAEEEGRAPIFNRPAQVTAALFFLALLAGVLVI